MRNVYSMINDALDRKIKYLAVQGILVDFQPREYLSSDGLKMFVSEK